MYAIDFEYNGERLSDRHFIVCRFNDNSGTETVMAGAEITFNMIPFANGKWYSVGGTSYDDCYTATFQICKDPDYFDTDDRYITSGEFSDISRWMNRRVFLRFTPIGYEEIDQYWKPISFYASFSLSKIMNHERCCGIELKMNTNSPFGYGDEETHHFTFTSDNLSGTLMETSDEIGFLYPQVTITCMQDGDIFLSNDLGQCQSKIKNCTAGEIIRMSGISQVITSSLSTHNLANDFNYDFFRLGNTYESRINTISVNSPCKVEIRYAPVLKGTI